MMFDNLDSREIARELIDGELKATRIRTSSSSDLLGFGLLCNTSEDLDIVYCLTRRMNQSINWLKLYS